MSSVRAIRAALVDVSRRYSRVTHEVEDLAHDLVVSALRRGFPIEGDAFLRSMHGAARRHGAFLARGAGRRRAREATAVSPPADRAPEPGAGKGGTPLTALSPGLRTTLLLLEAGLAKVELMHLLGVSDVALRKRFQALRDRGPFARFARERRPPTAAAATLRRSQIAMLPRLAAVRGSRDEPPRMLAGSDPDGHGIILTEAFTRRPRTATAEVSAAPARTPTKGTPC